MHFAPVRDPGSDLAALDVGFGAWDTREESGEEYVERIRSGRRLRELKD